ncbi:hypothetical protein Tco_1525947 [Tanacetum coccineum]
MGKRLLGPNGGSGGLIEGKFDERCGGNGRRGGSMSEVGEGKVDSIGGMGGGSLAIRLMVSNDGRGGRGLVIKGGSSLREGGEVNGEGVDLGVSKRLLLEVAGEMISESDGIEVREVGGGAETWSMRVGEGKVDSIGRIGGGLLAIRSMVSNNGRGGGGLVVKVGVGGGEVNDGGVDLEVSKRLEVLGEMIDESGGIEVGEVGEVPRHGPLEVREVDKVVTMFEDC